MMHSNKHVAPSLRPAGAQFKADHGKSLSPPPFQLKAETPNRDGSEGRSGSLPTELVSGFAAHTGHDLGNVKVQRDSEKPAEVGALAYAQGNEIHLGPGQEQHLPHEAAHIVQQREGRVQPTTDIAGKPVNDSRSLENEADLMGEKAASQLKKGEKETGVADAPQFAETAQLLKMDDGETVHDVDINSLSLKMIYDYLTRTNVSNVTYEEGDRERLRARMAMLVPIALADLKTRMGLPATDAKRAQRGLNLGAAETVAMIDQMAAMAQSGAVTGFDEWIANASAGTLDEDLDHLNELREAKRRMDKEGVSAIDLKESAIEGSSQTSDMTHAGAQVEVKTIREPIDRPEGFSKQLSTALVKFQNTHKKEGVSREIVLYASINSQWLQHGKQAQNARYFLDPLTLDQRMTISKPGGETLSRTIEGFPDTVLRKFALDNKGMGKQVDRIVIYLENARGFELRNESGRWESRLL